MDNQLSSKKVLEYAILAQQCYATSKSEIKLPEGWVFITQYVAKQDHNTACTVYIDGERKELTVGIRGSATLANVFTNGLLVLDNAFGLHNVPNGHYAIKEFVKGDCIKDYADMAETLQDLVKKLSTYCITVQEVAETHAESLKRYQESSEPTQNSITVQMDKEALVFHLLEGLSNLDSPLTDALTELTKIIKGKGFELKVIGHSLGGLLAQLLAVELGVRCVTFESPGSLEIIKKHPRLKNNLEKSSIGITNYFSAPNVINTFGEHPGSSYRMFLPLNVRFLVADIVTTTVAAAVGAMYAAKYGIKKPFIIVAAGGTFISLVIHAVMSFMWLTRQHSIDIIVKYLSGEYGEVKILPVQAKSSRLIFASHKWMLTVIQEVFREIPINVIEPRRAELPHSY